MPLPHRSPLLFVFVVCALSLGAAACSGAGGDSPSSSSMARSTANHVDCDVDYSQLDTAGTAGFRVDDPTDHKIAPSERLRHLNELVRMPAAAKALFVGRPLAVELTGGSVVEFSEFANLKGVTPRGWQGTGYTWDDVPGTADSSAVFLGDSGKANNANSLALHESTHTVDRALNLSATSKKLQALYDQDRSANTATDNLTVYRLSNIEEYLAVGVDEYACSARTKASLEAHYPALFQWIDQDYDGEVSSRSGGGGGGGNPTPPPPPGCDAGTH